MSHAKSHVEYPSDREMVFTRSFDAPRELVWQAWTDPKQVVHWWGPKGFTNTIHEMNVRVGGLWRLTMHGPDGVDYPNRIEFLEVEPLARLVYHHGDDSNPHMFHVTTTFTAEGAKTKIVTHIRFKTAAECAAVKGYAVDGHNTSMVRLDGQLADLAAADRTVVNTRLLPVPPIAAFAAFSDPKRLAQWWGPNGFTNTIAHFDFTPGGMWRYTMHAPTGADYHNESQFVTIEPDAYIELLHLGPMHRFQLKINYTSVAGGTRLTWRQRFENAEELTPIRAFLTDANDQNLARLADHLNQQS